MGKQKRKFKPISELSEVKTQGENISKKEKTKLKRQITIEKKKQRKEKSNLRVIKKQIEYYTSKGNEREILYYKQLYGVRKQNYLKHTYSTDKKENIVNNTLEIRFNNHTSHLSNDFLKGTPEKKYQKVVRNWAKVSLIQAENLMNKSKANSINSGIGLLKLVSGQNEHLTNFQKKKINRLLKFAKAQAKKNGNDKSKTIIENTENIGAYSPTITESENGIDFLFL